MPRKLTITVYAYDELSINARKAAVKSIRKQMPNKRICETDEDVITRAKEYQYTFDHDGHLIM